MRQPFRSLFFLAAFPLAVVGAQAAPDSTTPFGLAMGMSAEALRERMTLTPVRESAHIFRTTSIRGAAPGFEQYELMVGPTVGLCKVTAVGPDVRTGRDGAKAREAFDAMESALRARYAAPDRIDGLREGARRRSARDWTRALLDGERVLASYWIVADGQPLPPTLAAVSLQVEALDLETVFLKLQVEYENFDACSAEIQRGR